jgi:hypothetical protein
MRILLIATFIFLFNTAFGQILSLAHERSHQTNEGVSEITWTDDMTAPGLFQIVHDDHHQKNDADSPSEHSSDHQCHHAPVLGIINSISQKTNIGRQTHKLVDPHFILSEFPSRIEYPPQNI